MFSFFLQCDLQVFLIHKFQVEERSLLLEKYLQNLSQDVRVATGLTFNGVLLAAQQETRGDDRSTSNGNFD